MQNQQNGQSAFDLKVHTYMKLIDKVLTRTEVARLLRCDVSTVSRNKKRFLVQGKQAFVHGLSGTQRDKLFTGELAAELLGYFTGKFARERNDSTLDYSNYSFSAFHTELLYGSLSELGYTLSYSCMYNGFINEGLISKFNRRQKESKGSKGARLNNGYSKGERIEIDACEEDWFGTGKKSKAHVAYCRGHNAPLAIWFEDEETTLGYICLLAIIAKEYGLPIHIRGDRRGTFVNLKKQGTADEYNTMFNRVLKLYNIDFYYSSNPDDKPGVEGFNRVIKDQLPVEFSRLGIKSNEQANAYMPEYCNKQILKKEKQTRGVKNVFEKKLSAAEIEANFIVKEVEVSVSKKGFIPIGEQDYLPIRNGFTQKYTPKSKVKVQYNHLGAMFQKLDKQRVELIHARSEEVPKLDTKKVTILPKKILDNSTLSYGKGIKRVLVKNNGRHLELPKGTEVVVEESEDKLVAYYNKCSYKLLEVDLYKDKHLLLPTKECRTKFDFTVGYNGTRYVIINKKRQPLIIKESTIVVITMHNYKLVCQVNGNEYDIVLLEDYEDKNYLPTSKYIYKQIIDNVINNIVASQEVIANYESKLLYYHHQ